MLGTATFCPTCFAPYPPLDGIAVYLAENVLEADGVKVKMRPKEAELVSILAAHMSRVVRRDSLMQMLYGGQARNPPEEKVLDIFVCAIRQKLVAAGCPVEIETVWGSGYKLVHRTPR